MNHGFMFMDELKNYCNRQSCSSRWTAIYFGSQLADIEAVILEA